MREPKDAASASKPPSALSEAELGAELHRRRQRRSQQVGGPALLEPTDPARPDPKHYASLELPEGASLDAVEQAYARLRAKYEPFATGGDVARKEAAQRLLDALRHACQTLRTALTRR